jgi:predicted RNA-binding Zn-ribbon protein involved in translation (DUF1610 family)
MGVALLAMLLVTGAVFLVRKAVRGFVCPFCGGPIRRVFEKTQCTSCGRMFYLWQARRR